MEQPDKIIGPLADQVEGLGKRIAMLEETLVQLKSLDLTLHEMQFIIYSYVEKINEGLALVQDKKIVWVNKAGCNMLGYEFNELFNKSAIELVHPEYRDKLSARFAMIQAGDVIPAGMLWPFITKSREIKWVRPFSYRVIYAGKPAIMTFYYDVTEERKVQEELSMRAEMLDSVSDSVFLLDMKGNIKYANKAMYESLGYTLDEITGMNIVDVSAKEFREKTEIRLKTPSRRKEGGRNMTVYLHKDGTRLPVSVRGRVITKENQDFILAVAREIVHEEESLLSPRG